MPAVARPYLRLMRVDRPIGTWLRLFPGWWVIAMTGDGLSHAWLMVMFLVEAVITRSLGCTINDIIDRDIDARVERTRGRPVASGQIPVPSAIAFAAVQLLVGLLVLAPLNGVVLALFALTITLAAVYPLMKRVMWWPQAFLGFIFNSSALMGCAAVTGGLDRATLLLYAGCVAWTLGYDTIYAHQDKRDDARIGVRSTALRLGAGSRWGVGLFYAFAVALWGAALADRIAWTAALVAMLAVGCHFAWQLRSWDPDRPRSCLVVFKSNQSVGWILLSAIVLARMAAW